MIREQAGFTQDETAEQLGVSTDTIAGWETARRPLTAVPVGQMLVTRHKLMQLGTPSAFRSGTSPTPYGPAVVRSPPARS
ncbi:helix-turn-helix domain-containing protein [Streptomyces sp. NPDC059575]|uniref:helix-turn-helix domain-containing protein n=1 Tax=Streptomyces sp. NPDC059575 TaxID=3346872 RepID=UPI0036C916F5